jgi:hypothetical protein
VDLSSTSTVTVVSLAFVSSGFISLSQVFRVGKAHITIVVVVVIGGGRTVTSVIVLSRSQTHIM